MKIRSLRSEVAPLAACLLIATACPAHAQSEAGSHRRLIEHKAVLVQRILADSPVVQRIRASGNDEAKRHLNGAVEKYLQAVTLVGDGLNKEADTAINEAMSLIGRARRLVPDPVKRIVEQRARYAQLLDSTQSMIASARRHAARIGARGDADETQRDIVRASGLIEEARSLADAERIDDANRALLAAERALLGGISRMLGSAALDYTPRFESASEEYRYEMERFRSFHDLVPVAVAEFKPPQEAVQLVGRYVEQSAQLRDSAAAQAERREYASALGAIREATGWLQRALTAAGLVVPQQ